MSGKRLHHRAEHYAYRDAIKGLKKAKKLIYCTSGSCSGAGVYAVGVALGSIVTIKL